MPNTTVQALKVDEPGNSLAIWLAAHHPDLFLTVFKQAQAANMKRGVRRLGLLAMGGQLGDDGVTTTFDTSVSDFSTAPSFNPDPGLTTVSFDPSLTQLPANLITDSGAGAGSGFLSSLGSGVTSVGSSIGDVLSSAGTSVLSALGTVGSYIPSAINSLSSLGKAYFGAQAANATAQTQQAVLQTQIARTATGQTAAPITYTTNAQGQLVPVYATQTPNGTVYQPLSSQGIASLTPSSVSVFLSQYGLWLAVGGAALFGFAMWSRSRVEG